MSRPRVLTGENRRAEKRRAFRHPPPARPPQPAEFAAPQPATSATQPRPDSLRRLLLLAPLSAALLLAGCGALQRLSEIGRPPTVTPTADPTQDPNWRPLTMPMPARQPPPSEADSLWRSGSRAFFKDQRAAQVGDLITVVVDMTDSANV